MTTIAQLEFGAVTALAVAVVLRPTGDVTVSETEFVGAAVGVLVGEGGTLVGATVGAVVGGAVVGPEVGATLGALVGASVPATPNGVDDAVTPALFAEGATGPHASARKQSAAEKT